MATDKPPITNTSRREALNTMSQTSRVQQGSEQAQALLGIGKAIIYLGDQVGELAKALTGKLTRPIKQQD